MKLIYYITIYCAITFSALTSCNKLVEIKAPRNSLTTSEIFADSVDAVSALAGVYSGMSNAGGRLQFTNAAITLYTGISSDELVPYFQADNLLPFYSNNLLANDATIISDIWTPAYKLIYQVNGIIEGVQSSPGLSSFAKKQITGEAKFLRALYYFYLINLFGDVPYLTSTDYSTTANAARTSTAQIYQLLVTDLMESQSLLPDDYSVSNDDRIRANKWAATALLARVYLYKGDYASAELQSSSLINATNLFQLNPDLNKVFLKNGLGNNEAILQLLRNTSEPPYDATTEGFTIIPTLGGYPRYYLSDQLLNAFEYGDQRRVAWVDSTQSGGTLYYYPYKYKIGQAQATVNAEPTEYYTVLRLAEQYLIHAEALAQQNKLSEAIGDLNIIRSRAGLPDLSSSLNQTQVLQAVEQERRIELFAEWGHRWLDLKRTGRVDVVMTVVTPQKNTGTSWQSYQQLYPIPFSERQNDPNLTQNPGY